MGKLDSFKPLESKKVQTYFSNSIQISEVMEWVLRQIGDSDVTISTYSTSDEFIRRVARLKQKGFIRKCVLICDIRAARKTLSIYGFIKSVFDDVLLTENHSKLIVLKAAVSQRMAAIVTSQNQTRGNRYECGVIINDKDIVSELEASLQQLKNKSIKLNELIKRTT